MMNDQWCLFVPRSSSVSFINHIHTLISTDDKDVFAVRSYKRITWIINVLIFCALIHYFFFFFFFLPGPHLHHNRLALSTNVLFPRQSSSDSISVKKRKTRVCVVAHTEHCVRVRARVCAFVWQLDPFMEWLKWMKSILYHTVDIHRHIVMNHTRWYRNCSYFLWSSFNYVKHFENH